MKIPTQPFEGRYTRAGECYEWNGAKFSTGYGAVRYEGRTRGAHRVAYEIAHGAIPDGLVIDHLCRNRACIRIEHLEAVTHRENCMRGTAPGVVAHNSGTCHRGHSLDDAYLAHRSNGKITRRCRTCHLERQRMGRCR